MYLREVSPITPGSDILSAYDATPSAAFRPRSGLVANHPSRTDYQSRGSEISTVKSISL